LNHIGKNVGKHLRSLQVFADAQSGAMQKAFMAAVYKTREEKPKELGPAGYWPEGAGILQRRIRTIAPHMFNFGEAAHRDCDDECPAKQGKEHVPHGLKAYIDSGDGDAHFLMAKDVFETYSTKELCEKLVCKCSTNICEGGNSLLWTQHLPKTFFRPKGSAGRVANAMLHFQLQRNGGTTAAQVARGLLPSEANLDKRKKIDEQTAK
jgi:hypothetical protein